MNKLIPILILLVTLISCTPLLEINYQNPDQKVAGHILTYHPDWENLYSYKEISDWINQRVIYQTEQYDTWADPQVTLDRGYGDCDDYGILFANIVYVSLGIKMSIIVVNIDDMKLATLEDEPRYIAQGGTFDHVMTYYYGVIIEPQNGHEYDGPFSYIYRFDEIFSGE